MVVIVGDAFARPMVRALEEAEARGTAVRHLVADVIVSGGVMWTPARQGSPSSTAAAGMLMDGLGSSEATGIAA